MKWLKHKALSDEDMECLQGTPLMESLQRNRLVIVYQPNDKIAKAKEIGLDTLTGLYFKRNLQSREDTVEILFELPEDLETVEQYITQYKLK